MRILLDAGHGGKDSGAVNQTTGRQEKDIALEVVLETAKLLREKGYNVLLTRDKDIYISPTERLKMIQNYKPDVFVSVHCNASTNPSASGVETIFRDSYDLGLAQFVHKSVVKHTGLKDRGIKHDVENLKRKLAVLNINEVAACLVEIGFISNDKDLQVIENEQLIAKAIAEGIENWT